jgi:NADP-dependent 3-hydroxy acid dehydrogenase YdfG
MDTRLMERPVAEAALGFRGWVLITGASRGIGAAIAQRLWMAGFGIILWARDGEALIRVAQTISATEQRTRRAIADLGDASQIGSAVAQTLPEGTELVGVVLNAGQGRWRPLESTTLDEWNATLGANLTGAFVTLKAALSRLDFTAAPIVVGILSDSVLCAFPDRSAYASSKAGMEQLLNTVRREYRDKGLRVAQIYPSRVDTCFSGSHDRAEPGMRANGLTAAQVADTVQWVFDAPRTVEIRRIDLSSIHATFGLEQECVANAH